MTVRQEIAVDDERGAGTGDAEKPPRPLVANFVTTEHFALQSARAATIAESTGRATMFLTSASGGLVALGLVATAAGVGTAFYAFGLVLLPTLAFVGLVTFERALQIGLEDQLLVRRIALLREYYLREAPELEQYLVSVPLSEVLTAGSLLAGRGQSFSFWGQSLRTVAGMVGVITAVLAGATAGLIAIASSGHSLAAALVSGLVVALAALIVLMRFQVRAYRQAATRRLPASTE